VRFDTNDYSLPVRWAHHPVQIKGFINRIEIWTQQQGVATHIRSYGRHQYVLTLSIISLCWSENRAVFTRVVLSQGSPGARILPACAAS
jgi:hypothetical protein